MRATARLAAALALTALLAAGTLAPGALASGSLPASASVPPRAAQLRATRIVLFTTRTVTPKIQRTAGFTGYATYTFAAPRGRRIVSASARITGATAHAVEIRGRAISHNRMRYTVRLVFPGEQGNPGKLVVRLGSIR